MRLKEYSTLKAASKVSFSKEGDIYKLTEKQYDPSSGEEIAEMITIVNLNKYKHQKSELERTNTSIEAKIAEITKIITDLEAL